MRKLYSLVYVLAIFVFMMSFSFAAEKVTLITGEWEPYTGEKIAEKGFFTEITTAVFKEMGVAVEYKFYPWKRAEMTVKNGEAFAAFPYIVTDERKRDFNFTNPVANSTGRFFYNTNFVKEEVKYNKFEDLKQYKIGGGLGYWYEKEFKEAGLTVEYVPKDENNIDKLKVGRVQLVAIDELVGWQLIKTKFPKEIDKFKVVEKPLNVSELCLMVSKNYKGADELTKKFNDALKSIKSKGIYGKILKKYNIKE